MTYDRRGSDFPLIHFRSTRITKSTENGPMADKGLSAKRYTVSVEFPHKQENVTHLESAFADNTLPNVFPLSGSMRNSCTSTIQEAGSRCVARNTGRISTPGNGLPSMRLCV